MNELCFMSNLTSSEWASWVQAVASVSAIAAGALGIWIQMGRQAAQDRRREAQQLRTIWTYAYHSRVELQFMAETGTDGRMFEPSSLQSMVKALAAIPLTSIPGAEAAIAVSTLTGSFFTLMSKHADLLQADRSSRMASDLFQRHLNATLLNFEFAEKVLRAVILSDAPAVTEPYHYSINQVPYPPLEPDR